MFWWRASCLSPAGLRFGDEQPVPGVEVLAFQQVLVAFVPTTGLQVGGKPVQAWPQHLVTGLGQHRDAGAYDRIEVGLGSTPVGRAESVSAVVGYRHWLDSGSAQQFGEAIQRHGAGVIERSRFG